VGRLPEAEGDTRRGPESRTQGHAMKALRLRLGLAVCVPGCALLGAMAADEEATRRQVRPKMW
jgi:hypothetical protein